MKKFTSQENVITGSTIKLVLNYCVQDIFMYIVYTVIVYYYTEYIYIYKFIYIYIFNLFTSKLDLNLRKKLVKCYVWSMAVYGAETWTLRATDQKRLESFEMWC